MKNFNPRHLRKKFANRNGSEDATKSRSFRRAAQYSKRFIHQSASALESPKFAHDYAIYSEQVRKGVLRKGG